MTGKASIQGLLRRVEESESRLVEQQWEYRRRNHAAGAWFRFRLLLAHCETAYILSESELASLLAQGFRLHPVGSEFRPQRSILLVPRDRMPEIQRLRSIPIRRDSGILVLPRMALVPFRGIAAEELATLVRKRKEGSP